MSDNSAESMFERSQRFGALIEIGQEIARFLFYSLGFSRFEFFISGLFECQKLLNALMDDIVGFSVGNLDFSAINLRG
jgi:hypothetical protein